MLKLKSRHRLDDFAQCMQGQHSAGCVATIHLRLMRIADSQMSPMVNSRTKGRGDNIPDDGGWDHAGLSWPNLSITEI